MNNFAGARRVSPQGKRQVDAQIFSKGQKKRTLNRSVTGI